MNTRKVAEEPGLTVFERVASRELIEQLNALIDASRHRWRPADGRRESSLAQALCELLRESGVFRAAEAEALAASRRWAVTTFGRTLPANVLYVLRCVNRDIPSQSHLRHFDSHALTLLIPLQVPGRDGGNGDLCMYKNPRGSISLMRNMVTKAGLMLQQNLPFAVRRAQTLRDLRRARCVRIVCEPGNVYAFNGFITLHTNLEVAAGERRSLIVHYYDPGLNAGLRHALGMLRSMRDRLMDAL
jgi:hypothetical protein